MMRILIRNISFLASFFAAVVSCSVVEMDTPYEELGFNLTTKVTDMVSPGTKATLLDSESDITGKTIKLYGWEDGSYWIKGVNATYADSKWSLAGSYSVKNKCNYKFLSYANLPGSGASITAPELQDGNITYTVTDITAAQSDVLLGRESIDKPTDGDVDIDFSHPYSSVRFKLGNISDATSISSISLAGVYKSGQTTYSQASTADGSGVVAYNWTGLGNANAKLEATGLSVTEGQDIATFLVIPQDLSSKNAVLTITYSNGSKSTKTLSSGSWTAGYTNVYTLDKIISVTISLSSTNVTNTGQSKIYVRATIVGDWFDDAGNIVAPWDPSEGTFTGLPSSGWTKSGNFYYYSNGIASGSSAPALYSSYKKPAAPVDGATLKIEVLIQAVPYNVNKTCQEAFEAL